MSITERKVGSACSPAGEELSGRAFAEQVQGPRFNPQKEGGKGEKEGGGRRVGGGREAAHSQAHWLLKEVLSCPAICVSKAS
jgi:hypothetical protein